MDTNTLNGSLADSAFLVNSTDMFVILSLSLLLIALNYYILNKDSHFDDGTHKITYFTMNFIGFSTLFLSFVCFFKNPESTQCYAIILFCEAIFWYSLRLSRKEQKPSNQYKTIYKYDSLVSYVNTSLVGSLYMLFVIIIYILNDFSINESNIILFGTLLLISVFKTLYGVYIGEMHYHFLQLHIYSYIFIIIAVFLSTTTILSSLLFNLNGYLLGSYSANEISQNKNNNFYSITFTVLLLILFFSGFCLILLTSSFNPLLPLFPVALLMARTLVQFKENEYSSDSQLEIRNYSMAACSILYVVLTGEVYYALIINAFK